jgi:hypothetical protein
MIGTDRIGTGAVPRVEFRNIRRANPAIVNLRKGVRVLYVIRHPKRALL